MRFEYKPGLSPRAESWFRLPAARDDHGVDNRYDALCVNKRKVAGAGEGYST